MQIKPFGEVVLCKDITFEDSGKYDLEQGHPGVVLLPTNEEDEYAYCIFMTSDKKRANREKERFIKYSGKSVKESYLNLHQIVKVKNNADKSLHTLKQEQFREILNSFYNYQIKLKKQNYDFMMIKDKIEILLNLLEINQALEINEDIKYDTIEDMLKYKSSEKIRQMYCTKLMLSPDLDKYKILEEGFKTERERNYAIKVLETYEQIRKMDFLKIDLSDLNNPLRNAYFACMNNNYLMGAESIFTDVSTLLLDDAKKATLDNFLQRERELSLIRYNHREEKRDRRRQKVKREKVEHGKTKKGKGRLREKINEVNKREYRRNIIGGYYDETDSDYRCDG